MEERLKKAEEEIQLLKDFINSLGYSNSIPLSIDKAFRNRLGLDLNDISAKTVSSATESFLADGAIPTSAAKVMDGFVKYNVNGLYVNVPYYND